MHVYIHVTGSFRTLNGTRMGIIGTKTRISSLRYITPLSTYRCIIKKKKSLSWCCPTYLIVLTHIYHSYTSAMR